ncbi:MAG: DMT family transporter [Burkholderiales bacterium]|nr:DMT family transporter [Burkholderiales bacterium]
MNIFLLLTNGLLIAATYALSKAVLAADVPVLTLLAWQLAPAAVLINLVAAWRGERPTLSAPHLRYYVVAGVLGMLLPYTITYISLAHLPAGVIGVAASLSAVMTYGIARAAGREPANLRRLIGLVLGLIGVLTLVVPKAALPSPDLAGWVLIAVLAPLSLAAGNVYRSAAWPIGAPPLSLAAGMLAVLGVATLTMAAAVGQLSVAASVPSTALAGIAAVALLTTAFYLTAFEMQRRTSPSFVAQMGYVISLGALAIGVVFLDETPSAWVWLAAGLVMAGIAVATRSTAGQSDARTAISRLRPVRRRPRGKVAANIR